MYSLILASASPRRRDILGSLALRFEVRPVPIDEGARPGESPQTLAERLAREKALAAASSPAGIPTSAADGGAAPPLILAADTLVTIAGEVLGKPRDADDAARMLGLLQGRTHDVLTGLALLDPGKGRVESGVERTGVTFAPMSPAQITEAVAATAPFDKAGAYGIQDPETWFISCVEGSFTNVVGLPTALLAALLARFGATFDDLR